MRDAFDNSALPVPADIAEPAAPAGQALADNGQAGGGKEPEDERKKRGNPWDTFRFKRFRGLERRAPKPSASE
jgi:hypothetical protein